MCENFNVLESDGLPEKEKSDAMYQAVMATVPEIQNAEFSARENGGLGLIYERIKSYIMQREAENRNNGGTMDQTQKSAMLSRAGP